MRVCLAPMGASLKDQTIKTNKFLPHSTLLLLYISNRVFPMCACLTALKQRRSQRFCVLFRYKNSNKGVTCEQKCTSLLAYMSILIYRF